MFNAKPPPDICNERKHPFSILLLLLLSLCVLDSSVINLRASGKDISVCEVEEEGVEECMVELPEELFGTAHDLFKVELFSLEIADPVEIQQRLSGICKLSPSLCSFGWVLPLCL